MVYVSYTPGCNPTLTIFQIEITLSLLLISNKRILLQTIQTFSNHCYERRDHDLIKIKDRILKGNKCEKTHKKEPLVFIIIIQIKRPYIRH